MGRDALDEVLSSKQKLRIADLVSVRPRTLNELADLTGITVQGVVRHLSRMEKLGFVGETKITSKMLPVRRIYSIKEARVADFSREGLTVVKVTKELEPIVRPEEPVKKLESLAADALLQRRRIKDQAGKLGKMIDELVSTEAEIGAIIRGLPSEEDERLLLLAAFTEETLEDAEKSLKEHYGLKDPKEALRKAISRAKRLTKR